MQFLSGLPKPKLAAWETSRPTVEFAAAMLCALGLTAAGRCCLAAGSAIDEKRDAAFGQLDTDNNKQLSLQEYLKRQGGKKVLQRDFQLFDLNGNRLISRSEFATMPGIGTAAQRGPMPDPFDGLLEQAIEAMDQAYDGWNHRPQEQMNSTFFAINFAASLATDNRRRLDREIVSQADPNGDHMVSREEAKRFLEIQLGIRWSTGERLRLKNGRVVNFARFMRSDANADDVISKSEFIETWWRPQTAEEDFADADRNDDGEVTLREFTRADGPNIVDPIAAFRDADTNLDAQLDAKELAASVPQYRKNLVSSALTGFDDDGDGKLSLNEYRLSMLGNFNYSWATIPKDENNDDALSFEEFVFSSKRNLFQLLRRFYFHHFDLDDDKKLSVLEFEFKRKSLHSLVLVSTDSSETREVYRRREFPTCGSPAVSHDGKWIAFDVVPVEGISKSRILKMTLDGQNVHNLCDGLMPTWSPDGTQFACSRYEGGSGVWIMNADGSAHQRISDGWAAQWSPDGKTIAYTNDNSLRAYDVESGKSRVVLEKNDHPYQYIFWNMCWSPDSTKMVFKGRLPNKQQLAIVHMTGDPRLKTYHASNKQFAGDLAWSPDGKRILFNMYSQEKKKSLLYQFSPDQEDSLKPVDDVDKDRAFTSVCFSPDGKWIVLASPN